jgi:pimeloyl-ACP methyl ester carboxylesterase
MTYVEEEVTFANSEITLAGTLTLPDAPARHPAVVLLQGSGPLNRDEEAFGMQPFVIIADFFARNGIAVLRYDSRGVGGSTGAAFQYTLSDVAEDALAAVRFLTARSDVDPARIGLCGHSQGGFVAPLCAARSEDVAFIICVSGGGTTGEENFLAQTRMIAEVDGVPKDEIANRIQSSKRIVNLVRNGAGRAELELEIVRMVQGQRTPGPEKENSTRRAKILDTEGDSDREPRSAADSGADGGTDNDPAAEVNCFLTLFSSSWFKSFLDHDARPVLESVRCPVLLIFGGLDRQVAPEMNREAMVSALERGGNSDYLVRTFPTANHLFQTATTGSPSEYGTLGKEFVPGFLELMSDWIHESVENKSKASIKTQGALGCRVSDGCKLVVSH